MIILILSLIFQSNITSVYATHQQIYARILFEQVYLYKSPTEDNSMDNIYFELPKTYFVELLDLNDNFYQAKYLNFIGYVKKDSVQAISGTPQNPFLTSISFRVYAQLSESLWNKPTNNSNLITTIPPLTSNIQYIGKISGESLIQGRTNVWYFCKYTSDKEHYGYIYSDFCDEMQEITPNTESVNYISNPTFSSPSTPIKTIPQNSNKVGVIVLILSIPAVCFVFILLKGTHLFSSSKIKSKEIVDY